jgi:hypothetical protein
MDMELWFLAIPIALFFVIAIAWSRSNRTPGDNGGSSGMDCSSGGGCGGDGDGGGGGCGGGGGGD